VKPAALLTRMGQRNSLCLSLPLSSPKISLIPESPWPEAGSENESDEDSNQGAQGPCAGKTGSLRGKAANAEHRKSSRKQAAPELHTRRMRAGPRRSTGGWPLRRVTRCRSQSGNQAASESESKLIRLENFLSELIGEL